MNKNVKRALVLDHLQQAERHVTDGRWRVFRQGELVAQLKRLGGYYADDAVQMLRQFEDVLALQILQRDRLVSEMAEIDNHLG
jgi:hypothetical protein